MRSLIFCLLLMSNIARAGENMAIEIGQPLPLVELSGRAGELKLESGEISYATWSSDSLQGRTYMLYIVAARMGIDEVNQALLDALEAEGGVEAFPEEKMKVVSMINIDDVFPMGGAFARSAFEEARQQPKNAHAMFVLDDASKAQKAWRLKRKSAAVIVLDSAGRVQKFKDGKLSSKEISEFISLLKALRDGE